MVSDQNLIHQIHELTEKFISGLPDQLAGLEATWTRLWRKGYTHDVFEGLIQQIHSLDGAAGSLGFKSIAKAAHNLQIALRDPPLNDVQWKINLDQIEGLFQILRTAIRTDQQIEIGELVQSLDSAKAVTANLQEQRADRLIFMVDDDPIQASDLAAQVGYFGYTVQVFTRLGDLEDAVGKVRPTVLLMDVSFPEGRMAGYEAIEALRQKFHDLPPVIFVSVNDDPNFRLQAVRAGGKAYFTKPVDVGSLIDVLDRLIFQDTDEPFRVLIVEDSRVQANYISVQLSKSRMVTETIADPLQVIDRLISFNPDLLLLDMYMPNCTGMELAQIIRQMEQFVSVPIVFLSAETDREIQLAAMGIGGDDFLTKPIEPGHLVAAVTTRIERYRKMRTMMIRDGLTGLLNHRSTKEQLIQEVERARRQNEPLAFAMLDLDHFKRVNDTFGHACGDRVLKSLAHMLHQRLRRSDTIGRFGGEEFAVIMPATDETNARRIMQELCDYFGKVRHHSGEKEFSVTFSCGVATFPNFEHAGSLSEAADFAMYAAKAAGRNQVVPASECAGIAYPTHPQPEVADQNHFETELARTVAYLSAINRISQTLMKQSNLQDAIAAISQEVVTLFKAQHVGVGLLNQDRTALEFIANSKTGWNLVDENTNLVILTEEPASNRVVQSGKAVFVTDATHNPLLADTRVLMNENEINTRAIIPLIVSGLVIGTMNIDFGEPDRIMNDAELELAVIIAGSIAGLIDQSNLFNVEQRQRQFFETLVENIPVAVEMIDLEARIQSWNPAAEKLFGFTPEEAIGHNIDDLLSSEETRQEAVGYTQTSMREGESIHAVTHRRRKDGSQVDVELLAVPFYKDGKMLGSMAIYHDIGQLLRARREAEAANEAKSSFLATMSHEIRTPLNAIVGMTTLLSDTQLTPEQINFTDIIRNSSDALLTIINNILDFSKIEAGRMELEEQPFDLRECIESAFDLVAARATEKGIDLAYSLDPAVPAYVVSDATRLRQILLNLLSNSIKFTNSGEVVLSVSVENPAHITNEVIQLHFGVHDTGIGISPENKDRLFRSFSQVDASTTRKYGGTGLGLAISKRLCELMGGSIWVESEGVLGKGSTFNFIIKAKLSTNPVPIFLNAKQPELSQRRVLIVDDNATNRYILLRQVQSWGMIPEETSDPRQALAWVREGRNYDVALLDMQMPEMDGATLASEIQQLSGKRSELPLVMLTSQGIKDKSRENVKFAAYLTKPIKPAILYSTLLHVLSPQKVETKTVKKKEKVSSSSTSFTSLRILLAEDISVNQKVALLLLERIGCRADVVSNGLEVLEALKRQVYDVIFMDVQMPEMDGLEASRAIRGGVWQSTGEHREEYQPYIIAMTANAMQGDRDICIAAGMDDYISKPVQLEELGQALGRAAGACKTGSLKSEEPVYEISSAAIDKEEFNKFKASLGNEDPELVVSLIRDFIEEGKQLVSDIHAGALNRNFDSIWQAAHSLKSTSQMFGALELSRIAKELEISGRNHTIQDLTELIDQLDRNFDVVQRALQG